MKARVWLVLLLCICSTAFAAPKKAIPAVSFGNGVLNVSCVAKTGAVSAAREQQVFLTADILPDTPAGTVKQADIDTPLGMAMGIQVSVPGVRTQAFWTVPGQPFLFTRATLLNDTAEAVRRKEDVPFSALCNAGADLSKLKLLGCDGLAPAAQGKTSYVYLVLADPETRAGIVAGWITHERASGITAASVEGGAVRLTARAEYGRLLIPANSSVEGEIFAVGYFDDVLDGLEAFASVTAEVNKITLPKPAPCGYCTWYHAQALTARGMKKLAHFCEKNRLRDYGLDTLQIDDGWQIGSRDFTAHNPKGPYPKGMTQTADTIKEAGFRPGLWLIPFGWDSKAPAFAEHQDWLVHREDGSIYNVTWAGDCLDMTHPGARDFLSSVVRRITSEWGYGYLKIDGLWTGLAAGILYPSPEYRDDGFGDAVFHDETKTNIDAYRAGLRLVREAAGPDVFILGCNVAQNMRSMGGSIGLVDGMRVGADISAEWGAITGCVPMAARLYFWHGKVWYNDPDCLLVREPLTLDQARAWGSLIGISGQLNLDSDWIPKLPEDRLDILKRTMPNHGGVGRPLDLLETDMPRVWHLRAGEGEDRRDIVGLFQWDNAAGSTMRIDPAWLGFTADTAARYVGFDFWENAFVAPFSGSCEFAVRPGSCRVIALQAALDRPQLVSTSRHITQGLVDVTDLKWDPERKCLSGVSHVIGEDPYELRLVRGPLAFAGAQVVEKQGDVDITAAEEAAGVRVTLDSDETQDVRWAVQFK